MIQRFSEQEIYPASFFIILSGVLLRLYVEDNGRKYNKTLYNLLRRRGFGAQAERLLRASAFCRREEKLDRDGNVRTLTKKVVRDIPPDPTSAMFWLTNRQPGKWSYKPQEGPEKDGDGSGVVMLPAVADMPQKGGGEGG